MRVLVVEDERDLAEAIAAGLRREGYAVDVAHAGDEALVKARVYPYDLICLDLNLPELGGREICRALRAHGRSCGATATAAGAPRSASARSSSIPPGTRRPRTESRSR